MHKTRVISMFQKLAKFKQLPFQYVIEGPRNAWRPQRVSGAKIVVYLEVLEKRSSGVHQDALTFPLQSCGVVASVLGTGSLKERASDYHNESHAKAPVPGADISARHQSMNHAGRAGVQACHGDQS